jgi:anti-anti-sigma regulatory factor/anti-sigma regulatory factor (Ser/Thr protein kinase)
VCSLYAGRAAVLTCPVDATGPFPVMRVAGTLDLAGAAQVRAALHKTLTDQPPVIVVDLAGLVVLDDVTLTVFSAFARLASAWPGCVVLLCAPGAAVYGGLDRIGITRTVEVYPDRTAALVAAAKVPAPRRYRRSLPAILSAARPARELVHEACEAWHLPHLISDAELVVTELVANVVRHVGGDMAILLTLRERYLHIAVRDGSTTRPERILPDPDTGEGGRGLLLLDAVATGWGSTEVPDGKIVWATLRLAPR